MVFNIETSYLTFPLQPFIYYNMFYNNPYGGWADAGQHPSAAYGQAAPPPSVFGALPTTSSIAPASNMATYHATSFSPTIFNSTVVGPQGELCFHIVTDNELSGYTVFKDAQNKSVALIEWKTPPTVELRGIMSGSARSWLRLSQDRRCVRIINELLHLF